MTGEALPSEQPSPLRGLIAGVLLMVAAFGVARLVALTVQAEVPFRIFASQSSFFNRTRAMTHHLAEIPDTKGPVLLMVGSSTVMFNFAPRVFDERLKEKGRPMTSYNLGIMSVVPDLLLSLAKRMHEDFDAKHRRVDVTVIEFTPQATTKKFQGARSIVMKRALLIRPEQLYAIAKTNPAMATELLQLKLLGGIGPKEITPLVGYWMFDPPPTWWTGARYPSDPENDANEALFRKMILANHGKIPDWDVPSRGEFRRLFPESAEEYRKVIEFAQKDVAMKRWLRFFTKSGDIVDLHFDEKQVNAFILAVKEYQAFSDKVYLTLAPRQLKYHQPSAEGKQHLEETIARIRAETGVELIDYFNEEAAAEFGPLDFFDLVHLTEAGKEKFSLSFAERMNVLLGAPVP